MDAHEAAIEVVKATESVGAGSNPHYRDICGVISYSGPNGEPLACAWEEDHLSEKPHSWASLPTFDSVIESMANLERHEGPFTDA